MKFKRLSLPLVAGLALAQVFAVPLTAQNPIRNTLGGGMGQRGPIPPSIKRTFVPLSGGEPGLLYEPKILVEKSHIGVFVMHAGADYLTFSACTELSERGYRVLCANTTNGASLNKMLLDAKRAVTYLRQYPGIRKVVLFGHSGGATIMTAYQDIAENGVRVCQGPDKLIKCPDVLAGLPPADGMVLADSNWGNAEMALFSLDPAVIIQNDGLKVNPDLDLFNPKNGFNPKGSNYSQEFIHKFQSAEGKRQTELNKTALERLAAIEAGKGRFADDEPFVVAGGGSLAPDNKLFPEDTRLMSHTKRAWPLIHPDGSVTNEIVHSVRVPEGNESFTPNLNMGANSTTVRTFLTDSAIRVMDNFGYDEDSVHGVEWTSSYSSPPGNVEGVTVPLLALGMTGHWEYLAAETIYENARSEDKSLAFVEGASHMYSVCKQCEKTPGEYGDTVETLYDYIDKWLSQTDRFTNKQTSN